GFDNAAGGRCHGRPFRQVLHLPCRVIQACLAIVHLDAQVSVPAADDDSGLLRSASGVANPATFLCRDSVHCGYAFKAHASPPLLGWATMAARATCAKYSPALELWWWVPDRSSSASTSPATSGAGVRSAGCGAASLTAIGAAVSAPHSSHSTYALNGAGGGVVFRQPWH